MEQCKMETPRDRERCHAKDFGHDATGIVDKQVGVTREATGSFKAGNVGIYVHLRKYSGVNVNTQRLFFNPGKRMKVMEVWAILIPAWRMERRMGYILVFFKR